MDRQNDERKSGKELQANVEKLAEVQDRLYAEDKQAILASLSGYGWCGKDGTIKHVMSGIQSQNRMQVYSFKQPSSENGS